jgi:hypothetical protein
MTSRAAAAPSGVHTSRAAAAPSGVHVGPTQMGTRPVAARHEGGGCMARAVRGVRPIFFRFGEEREKMTWHGGTHELGRRIGKLLYQIVF